MKQVISSSLKVNKYVIGWECSLDGGEKNSKQNSDRETPQKVATLKKKETEGG